MGDYVRVLVVLSTVEAGRCKTYCRETAHKASLLIVRLVSACSDGEGYGTVPEPTAARNWKRNGE